MCLGLFSGNGRQKNATTYIRDLVDGGDTLLFSSKELKREEIGIEFQ